MIVIHRLKWKAMRAGAKRASWFSGFAAFKIIALYGRLTYFVLLLPLLLPQGVLFHHRCWLPVHAYCSSHPFLLRLQRRSTRGWRETGIAFPQQRFASWILRISLKKE
jgi:hypothetical protein